MTLFGKVLIVNSLIGSLFVNRVSAVMQLMELQLKKVINVITDFIWKGKKPKIAYRTLTKSREQGGIRLVDLSAKQESLRIRWIF